MRLFADQELVYSILHTAAGDNCQLHAPLWTSSKQIGRSDYSFARTCVAYNDREIILVTLGFWNPEKIENFIRIPFTDLKRVETYHRKIAGSQVTEVHLIPTHGRGYQLNLQRELKTIPEQSQNLDTFLKKLSAWMYN